jgi:hypothetical protein
MGNPFCAVEDSFFPFEKSRFGKRKLVRNGIHEPQNISR